jgi:signal transduction histidine kinase
MQFLRPDSLAFRLGAIATVWTAIFLIIAGLTMSAIQRVSAERSFDNLLEVYSGLLTADLAETSLSGNMGVNLDDPRFRRPNSGWYWRISRASDNAVFAASRSLFDPLPSLENLSFDIRGTRSATMQGPGTEALRLFERRIILDNVAYTILVAGDAVGLEDDIANFRATLFLTLSILGVGLVLASIFQVSIGLRPLDRLRDDLKKIHEGQAEKLEGHYPAEIKPLISDLNTLMTTNREVIERARHHVGNLAHALKTPLSVIINEARSLGTNAAKVLEQTSLMQRHIDVYLNKARRSATAQSKGSITAIKQPLEALVRVMRKLNEKQGVEIVFTGDDSATFRGEKQDFEEIAGNVLENACKHAKAKVHINVETLRTEGARNTLKLTIEDDGPGIPQSDYKTVLRRGQRLDETKPGSGLGLSIVNELTELYGGNLSFSESKLGGLKADIILPAV